MLGRLQPYAAQLNSEDELDHVHTILRRGASAEQQLQLWRDNGHNLIPVVDQMVSETETLA